MKIHLCNAHRIHLPEEAALLQLQGFLFVYYLMTSTGQKENRKDYCHKNSTGA